MEMRGCIFLRVIWVAGTRMIEQGTDGLSRGDLMTGIMAGSDMLLYVPLNKTVEERQSGVVDWITKKATTLSFWKTLSAQDWFDTAFEEGNLSGSRPQRLRRLQSINFAKRDTYAHTLPMCSFVLRLCRIDGGRSWESLPTLCFTSQLDVNHGKSLNTNR